MSILTESGCTSVPLYLPSPIRRKLLFFMII